VQRAILPVLAEPSETVSYVRRAPTPSVTPKIVEAHDPFPMTAEVAHQLQPGLAIAESQDVALTGRARRHILVSTLPRDALHQRRKRRDRHSETSPF